KPRSVHQLVYGNVSYRARHSFHTRRSADLDVANGAEQAVVAAGAGRQRVVDAAEGRVAAVGGAGVAVVAVDRGADAVAVGRAGRGQTRTVRDPTEVANDNNVRPSNRSNLSN